MSSAACSAASLRPPSAPRLAIERMNTPGSRKWSVRRIRSPSSAPLVNGEDGSMERTATDALTLALELGQRAHERRLAHSGRPGEADDGGAAGLGVDRAHQLPALGIVVLDQRYGAGQGAAVALEQALGKILVGPGHSGQ